MNYWESKPAALAQRLDVLLRHGITQITTFVPWQALESDITHSLARFLQSAAERKMHVSLILTPEVGVHYFNSGLPKDILTKPENLAKCFGQGDSSTIMGIHLPPNGFPLPSLFAPEFLKRYHNFLARVDHLLADLGRTQPHVLERVTAVLTGSFWKYYRSPKNSAREAFGGVAGDYSGTAGVAYRQHMEKFFGEREFSEHSPTAANRWKTRQLEEVNRRTFYQTAENLFRQRTTQSVRRKAIPMGMPQGLSMDVNHVELYTPEADPSNTYSNFLMTVSGGHADFHRLSALVDEAAMRSSSVSGFAGSPSETTLPILRWTGFGGFRTLSDAEKQFLILKSLLLMGSNGGSVLIDDEEWFSMSQAFRARTEVLARALMNGDLKQHNQALFLTSHLWSGAGTLWSEWISRTGIHGRMVASADAVISDSDARLVLVDPTMIFTRDIIEKLSAWARGGRVVILPRSPLFSDNARSELERAVASSERIEMKWGVSYQLYRAGQGQIVLYDMPSDLKLEGQALEDWRTFMRAMFSLAQVQPICSITDGRLNVIPLTRKNGGLGVFVLNGTGRSVSADLVFSTDVTVSDLALSLAARDGAAASNEPVERPKVKPSNRFSLDVPPCGVLPIAADGVGFAASMHFFESQEERKRAAETAELMKANVLEAATSELPGFSTENSDDDFPGLNQNERGRDQKNEAF